MPFPALPAPASPLGLAVALVLLPAAVLGCSVPPSARARMLPEVLVTFRRSWTPRDVSVEGSVSFPLRRVRVGSAVAPPAWRAYEPTLAELERDTARAQEDAWAPEPTRTCRRVDTCAWERVRAARVLAAWGVAP
ncbi:MAG: hypothetical protein IPN77_01460 [Sandaracinaceae bacterium]|nr:hypothetical protein [Sandaracinaceae bacterium]